MEELKKKIIRKNKEYEYVGKCNDNLFLYRDNMGFITAFTKFDLGLIDNKNIDKILRKKSIKLNNVMIEGDKIIVYDKIENTEIIYSSVAEASRKLNIPRTTLDHKIKNKQWIYNRWFVEKIMD